MWRCKTICGLVLSGLTGCMMGPDYHVQAPVSVERWQAASKMVLQPAHTEGLKAWWTSFGDAELNKLIDQALGHNLDLKIALTRIEQARAERRGVRAELFPAVNAMTGVQRQHNPFPGLAHGIKYDMFELGFDALWEIDLFGRQQRRLESVSAELDAANESYHQAQVSLSAELTRSYVEYRNLQHQLRIARSNLQSQRQTLALTEKRFDEGVDTRHDVARARAQTETTNAQIAALEADLLASLRQLEVLVGERPGALHAELDVFAALPKVPSQVFLTSPVDTILQRPDLRAAERRLAAATAMQGAAMAELFPKISLSAFFGLRNTDIESLFKSAAFSYGTAANLMQPLLNFGRIQAGIDLAEARQKEAYLAYEKGILDALRETETALTRYLQEEVRRQALTRSVAECQEALRLSQLRYREGVVSLLDILDDQRSLYMAEMAGTRSQAETIIHLISFYKSLGGQWSNNMPL